MLSRQPADCCYPAASLSGYLTAILQPPGGSSALLPSCPTQLSCLGVISQNLISILILILGDIHGDIFQFVHLQQDVEPVWRK